MRRKLIGLVLALVLVAGVVMAAEEGDEGLLNPWRSNYATPSVGFAFLPFTVTSDQGEVDEELGIPGLDLRIFRGVNVTKRGGFYTGVEVGALFFFTPEDAEVYSDDYLGTAYDISLDYQIAMAFIMMKYGLRIDVGVILAGVSLGLEVGLGARIANGYFDINTEVDGFPADGTAGFGTASYAPSSSSVDVIADVALQAGLRLGRNFRAYLALGAMFTPAFLDPPDRDPWLNLAPVPGDDEEAAQGLAHRYEIEFLPAVITGRIGFIVNYE
jgi:hypothetical protein